MYMCVCINYVHVQCSALYMYMYMAMHVYMYSECVLHILTFIFSKIICGSSHIDSTKNTYKHIHTQEAMVYTCTLYMYKEYTCTCIHTITVNSKSSNTFHSTFCSVTLIQYDRQCSSIISLLSLVLLVASNTCTTHIAPCAVQESWWA